MAWLTSSRAGAQHSRAERHLLSTETAAAAVVGDAPEVLMMRKLLEQARAALQAGNIEECWHLLNAARRNQAALGDETARRDAGRVLLIETEKISAWRRKSIEKLLGDGSVAPVKSTLMDALLLRDDFYENRYHRIELQREQMGALVMIAAAALLLTLGVTAVSDVQKLDVWDWRSVTLVLLFGVLGASFSAARTSSTGALTTLIPDLMQSGTVAFARTILGACPGLAAYAFLHSGLLQLGDPTMAKSLTVAFVGGFSERLVVKMVETVAGKDTPAKS